MQSEIYQEYEVDYIKSILPGLLKKKTLIELFNVFYVKRKKKKNLGIPSFSNFKVYIKLLAREFMLLHYNTIFLDSEYQRYRKSFFNVISSLTLINSKPAIHAVKEQETALHIEKDLTM